MKLGKSSDDCDDPRDMPESVFSTLLFSIVDPSELAGETTFWLILPGELAFCFD